MKSESRVVLTEYPQTMDGFRMPILSNWDNRHPYKNKLICMLLTATTAEMIVGLVAEHVHRLSVE